MNGQREYFTMPDPINEGSEAQCYVDCEMVNGKRVVGDYGQLVMEGTKIVMSLKPAWMTPEILKKVASKIKFNDLEKNQSKINLAVNQQVTPKS